MKKTVSIGRKLMTGTAAMFLLAAILGACSVYSLRNFKHEFDRASDETMHNVVLADAVVTANSEMISNQRGIILAAISNDKAGFAKYQGSFKENFERIHTSLGAFVSSAQNAELEALRADVASNIEAWRPHYDDVVSHAAGGDLKEADRIRREVTAPIYNKLDKDARRMAAIEVQAMADNKAALASRYQATLWISLVMLVAIVVAAGIVFKIVQGVTKELRSTASELSQGAEQVGSAAAQVSASSQALASGSSEQAASLETTSASTEQINSMARRNSESSQTAAVLVAQSQQKFSQANQSLEEMVEAMTEINSSSDKISKIIKVIDEIAFQTNILALNAAVEAARAGEAGMGFAVVADEVRNLAQRSAQAAKDTASLIEESISRSKSGKSKVDQVADAIRQISAQSAELKILIEEVNVGSLEQARGLEQVARAIVQMEQVTQSTAASAEQSASASEELTAQSLAVKDVVERLTGMVEGSRQQIALVPKRLSVGARRVAPARTRRLVKA